MDLLQLRNELLNCFVIFLNSALKSHLIRCFFAHNISPISCKCRISIFRRTFFDQTILIVIDFVLVQIPQILRRRCNRGPEKKVQRWTWREGATMDLRRGATVDLRRRCNRGPKTKMQPWTWEESAIVDLRRRCNSGLEKKVQPWTLEEGAAADLRRRCNNDLRRRCNRGPEKKVQPGPEKKVQRWTREKGATVDSRGKGATVDLRGESATVDLRREYNRKTLEEGAVQPWTREEKVRCNRGCERWRYGATVDPRGECAVQPWTRVKEGGGNFKDVRFHPIFIFGHFWAALLKISGFYPTGFFRQFWADPIFSSVWSIFLAEEEASQTPKNLKTSTLNLKPQTHGPKP